MLVLQAIRALFSIIPPSPPPPAPSYRVRWKIASLGRTRSANIPGSTRPRGPTCSYWNSERGCTTNQCTYEHKCSICNSFDHCCHHCPQRYSNWGLFSVLSFTFSHCHAYQNFSSGTLSVIPPRYRAGNLFNTWVPTRLWFNVCGAYHIHISKESTIHWWVPWGGHSCFTFRASAGAHIRPIQVTSFPPGVTAPHLVLSWNHLVKYAWY